MKQKLTVTAIIKAALAAAMMAGTVHFSIAPQSSVYYNIPYPTVLPDGSAASIIT